MKIPTDIFKKYKTMFKVRFPNMNVLWVAQWMQ